VTDAGRAFYEDARRALEHVRMARVANLLFRPYGWCGHNALARHDVYYQPEIKRVIANGVM
jgi:hypothetical protein